MTWWSAAEGGIYVMVRVTPGARATEIVDARGERLRVRVAAPAHEGKANEELRRFVARAFGVRRAAVSVVRGERSREKTLWIAGADEPPRELRSPD